MELLTCKQKIVKSEKLSRNDEIKQANVSAIYADETSDVSNLIQVAVAFKYIVKKKNRPTERL